MTEYVLVHHGIKGQRWGVRRFQNADGSLTNAGRKRLKKKIVKSYNEASESFNKKLNDINRKYDNQDLGPTFSTRAGKKYIQELDREWRSTYTKTLKKNNPELLEKGDSWVKDADFMDMYASYYFDYD